MTPLVFHASVHSFRSDPIGESKLTLAIPDCDKLAAFEAGQLTSQILLVTVMKAKDVNKHLKGKK
jgi:hypothetical protein